VISAANPRYFTVAPGGGAADGKAVYLTGSHIWNNFHDGMGPGPDCAETAERLDFGAYLDFLSEHGHNFIRLWRWEHIRSQAAGGAFHLCMAPQPWRRPGPGTATDGKPKFDLTTFDAAYFDRLRSRVVAAGEAGIYVAVMFFDGFALHLTPPPLHVEGHPFHAANNVNGISLTSIVDHQVLPLDPRVRDLQEAYLRRVVDTVHDLPNVLYEVANESSGTEAESVEFPDGSSIPGRIGDSTRWQYWVIDVVRRYEQERGYVAHPIGMTMQYPVRDQSKVNEPLYASPADWISPGFEEPAPGRSRWYTDPPAADGRKVVISDTDHYAAGRGDALWAWKSFLRGHHPILMDFGLIGGVDPADPYSGDWSYESFQPARYAMGDTRRFAERIALVDMRPRGDLTSTGYALADAGHEYLILQPDQTGGPVTVTPDPGTYAVEWFDLATRQTAEAGTLTVGDTTAISVRPPFQPPGPAVLHLRRTGR
jgi:hypothetical protein